MWDTSQLWDSVMSLFYEGPGARDSQTGDIELEHCSPQSVPKRTINDMDSMLFERCVETNESLDVAQGTAALNVSSSHDGGDTSSYNQTR
jgi:hypothetical protein